MTREEIAAMRAECYDRLQSTRDVQSRFELLRGCLTGDKLQENEKYIAANAKLEREIVALTRRLDGWLAPPASTTATAAPTPASEPVAYLELVSAQAEPRKLTDAERAFCCDIGRRLAHGEVEHLRKRTVAPRGQRFSRDVYDNWADKHWAEGGKGHKHIRSAVDSLFDAAEADCVALELCSSAAAAYFMTDPRDAVGYAERDRAGEIEKQLAERLAIVSAA